MSKLNEYAKILNEESAQIIKRIKADQVKTSEVIQRMRRLEQTDKPKETENTDKINANVVSLERSNTSQGRTQSSDSRSTGARSDDNRPRRTNDSTPQRRQGSDNRSGNSDYKQRSGGYNKPGATRPGSKSISPAAIIPSQEKEKVSNYDPKKSTYQRKDKDSDKKTKNRKQMIKQTGAGVYEDERYRNRKMKKKPVIKVEPVVITNAIVNTENVTVKELSEKIGKPSAAIIKQLLVLGIFATINQEIDFDTASLICEEFGVKLEYVPYETSEDKLLEEEEAMDSEADLINRPPVVTIMGHVDHGKTSLLDAIRATKVTAGEAGGITQHIGAYSVEINKKKITFLDTPGHEAFTSMRARGASVTDIAILVVAADDGIMPQTVEAISHAKAAEVPIIVAINKIDKPAANIEKVKQELTEHGLVCEEWGGDTIVVPVSAHTREGIDNLLEMILLVADVQELKANPDRHAKGAIIEAKLDKGRGPVATVLVQNGSLHVGDTVIAGTATGRVRAMINDDGEAVKIATPSMPVEILGFGDVPFAGDIFYSLDDDKLSRQVAEERKDKIKIEQSKASSAVTLDDLFDHIAEGEMKVLNLIVKADVQGSAEAIKQSVLKLSTDEVKIDVIHSGVGSITQSDIILANASNAIVIGFNVVADASARAMAEKDGVDIRTYRIIYKLTEDIEKALIGMLDPEFKEVIQGHVEVRQVFKVSSIGTIAGCYVLDGKITRNSNIRLSRDGVVIHEGTIASLKRFKENAKEVVEGYECGIGIEDYNDIKVGDLIESYVEEEVKR